MTSLPRLIRDWHSPPGRKRDGTGKCEAPSVGRRRLALLGDFETGRLILLLEVLHELDQLLNRFN